MSPHDHPDPRDEGRVAEEVGLRFERLDADAGIVARWAVGLGALTVLFAAVSVWLLLLLRGREEKQDPQRPALYFGQERRQPEGVRLQASPFTDLHALREQEGRILDSYGWVDQAGGVVHIPIEEAMRRYVARQAGGSGAAPMAPPGPAAGTPTDSAPVPSPAPPVVATPGPPAPAVSPMPSGPPAPPAPHGPGPSGAHR